MQPVTFSVAAKKETGSFRENETRNKKQGSRNKEQKQGSSNKNNQDIANGTLLKQDI